MASAHDRPGGSAPPATTAARWQAALALHRQGQLAAVQAICLDLLKQEPRNPAVLHLLGVTAAQTNHWQPAVELLSMAITLRPPDPVLLNDLGNAQAGLGQWEAALASYDQAIARRPDEAAAYNNRGSARQQLRQPERALADYEAAIARRPDYPAAFYNRGNVLRELGRPAAAVASYERALALNPDFAAAHYGRGTVLWRLGHRADALVSLERAIALQPDAVDAYNDRGVVLHELGQPEAALASLERAITLQPEHALAHFNRGTILNGLGQAAHALASLERAIALRPDYAEAHNSHGVVLKELGQYEAALASLERAIALRPDYAEAHNSRGVVLKALGQYADARASLERAIALQPDYAEAHWNRALLLLLQGDFEQGWPLYEWRWRVEKWRCKQRHFHQPRWSGEASLAGRTILLYHEQGLGDTLQFCRYAALVAARGGRVILEVPPALAGLLRGLAGVARLVVRGEPLPPFDLHCPLHSLPLALGTTLDTIPAPPAYLHAVADKVQYWRDRLGTQRSLRVGLAWSGSAGTMHDGRAIALARLLPSLPATCTYVSLQREVQERDRAALAGTARITHYGAALTDFAETAALCELMDVVVSVDTSVAHLAGALGKETWLMLPFSPDWRWRLGRTESLWYPRVRLYRQARRGDWTRVCERIGADLAIRSANHRQGAGVPTA